jgi:hypothetical protein
VWRRWHAVTWRRLRRRFRPGCLSTRTLTGKGWSRRLRVLSWRGRSSRAPGYGGKRDILYDSIEAPPDTDILTEGGRKAGLRAAYMDAPWNDIDRICDEMADRRTSVADQIRFYLNGLAAEEDSWVEPANFDNLAEQKVLADGDQIAMFLDCSKSEDSTGVVGCRLDDMYCFTIDVWERPKGWPQAKRWLAPREEVDATVRAAVAKYDVQWFGIDPSPAKDDDTENLYWADMIDALHRDLRDKLPVWATPGEVRGNSVLFDMRLSQFGGKQRNQAFTEAAELVQTWIDEEGKNGIFRHDGDPRLRTHVHNAKIRPNQWGDSLGKASRDSKQLVDLAVCMVGAVMGARIVLNSGKRRKKKNWQGVLCLIRGGGGDRPPMTSPPLCSGCGCFIRKSWRTSTIFTNT